VTVDASTGAGAAHLSIGEVLGVLRDEFPDVTISKIRFLESQGLIDPERTPSGYRKFYESDVSRLRWILHQQKDNFLPLKVIKERLDRLDDGESDAPATASSSSRTRASRPRDSADAPAKKARPTRRATARESSRAPELPLVDATPADEPPIAATPPNDDAAGSREEDVTRRRDVSLTRRELASAAGLSDWQLGELESYGLLAPATRAGEHGLFNDQDLAIARAAAGFARHGIEARHLRMYKHFADRETALFEQVLVQLIRQRNPQARAKAQEEFASLARLGRQLRAALLVQTMRDSLSE
jgi:DNA-binding transcriptional MerR regulator